MAVDAMQVTNAITRQKKEQIVSDLKDKLGGSAIVFGMRFKGLDVSVPGQGVPSTQFSSAWGSCGS